MKFNDTALVLIGFQNDYFSADGILYSVIEENRKVTDILANIVKLISTIKETLMAIVATPIIFTPDYRELDDNPVGILKTIKELGAFQAEHSGSDTVTELLQFGMRIGYIPGKHGLKAFSNTNLESFLKARKIKKTL